MSTYFRTVYFRSSYLLFRLRVVEVIEKFDANTCSDEVLAQDPSGFLTIGITIIDLLNLFVVFQNE